MVARNIERFNEITGQVFACLYESFPLPMSLRPKLLGIEEHEGGEYSPEVGEVLGVEPQSAEEVLFKHTVIVTPMTLEFPSIESRQLLTGRA